MVNNKEQGTHEDALIQSEVAFLKYKKPIIIAVIAIVVVVAGFFLYKNFVSGPREDEASTELAKSQTLFNGQQYDQALAGFQKIQSDYSGTDAGNLANLYVALCYAHQAKPNWAKALENAEKFSTSDDEMISPASQMALGDIYANNNQNDKAVECFKKAAKMADSEAADNVNLSIAPLALRKAGVLLESEGKKAEALEIYKNIKKTYVNSPLYQDIDKYIERASNSLDMATELHHLSDYDAQSVPDASNMCFGIVVAEWNPEITGALLDGAVKTLEKHGAIPENIHIKTVPGSFELVYGAQMMTKNDGFDAVIILGSVIRGETPHFDYICQGVTYGIARLNASQNIPVIYGLLTTDDLQQAKDRSGGKLGNKGDECAIDAIKMAKF